MWVGIDSLVRRHGDRLLTPHCNKPTSAATLPCSSVTSLEHHSGLRWGHDTALCRYSPPQNRNETSFTRDASDNSWPKQLLPKAIQKVCHYESGKSSANCGLRFHCGTFSIVFRFVSLRILVFCCRYLGMMFLDGFDLVVCVLNWSLNNVVFVCSVVWTKENVGTIDGKIKENDIKNPCMYTGVPRLCHMERKYLEYCRWKILLKEDTIWI